MMPLPIRTITIYFFQNKTSQIYAEKNKDYITITHNIYNINITLII
jgi:hypothetical protein